VGRGEWAAAESDPPGGFAQKPLASPFPHFFPRLAQQRLKMQALAAQVDAVGRRIVELSNPELNYDTRATKGMPFIELSEALPVALAYLGLVMYGNSKYAAWKAAQAGKPAAADAAAKKGGDGPWTLSKGLAKLNGDKQFPVVWLLFFYNIVQVRAVGPDAIRKFARRDAGAGAGWR
jgi:hypothetical protein